MLVVLSIIVFECEDILVLFELMLFYNGNV